MHMPLGKSKRRAIRFSIMNYFQPFSSCWSGWAGMRAFFYDSFGRRKNTCVTWYLVNEYRGARTRDISIPVWEALLCMCICRQYFLCRALLLGVLLAACKRDWFESHSKWVRKSVTCTHPATVIAWQHIATTEYCSGERDQTISFLIEDLTNDPFIIEDLEKRKGNTSPSLRLQPIQSGALWLICIDNYLAGING